MWLETYATAGEFLTTLTGWRWRLSIGYRPLRDFLVLDLSADAPDV